MPVAFEDAPLAPQTKGVRIAHSDVTELFFASHRLRAEKSRDEFQSVETPAVTELLGRIEAFWGEGGTCSSEIISLAWQAGTLFEPIESFFASFAAAAAADIPETGFEHETEEERERILRRLRVLRHEPARARALLALLRELWTVVEPLVADARADIEAAQEELRTELAHGADVIEILPEHSIIHRFGIEDDVRRAARSGQLSISLSVLAGKGGSFLELPGLLTIALGIGAPDDDDRRREAAQDSAARLKVLADPSRLEVLMLLRTATYSVSDLARRMGLAQPTISVHVKMLREAGLLRSQKERGRTLYHADTEHLRSVLAEVGQTLEKH